jgi:hypothetical protein
MQALNFSLPWKSESNLFPVFATVHMDFLFQYIILSAAGSTD